MTRASCNKPYMHVVGAQTTADPAAFQINENFSWDDIRIAANTALILGLGSDPTLVTWKAVARLYAFVPNDELGFSVQIPHHYAIGEDLKVHVHWTPMGRGVVENGNTVPWKVDMTPAPIGGVFPAVTTYDLTDACDGTDDKHQMTADVPVVGTSLTTVSSMLIGRVYRDVGGTWAGVGAANAPALLEIDFHFPIDTLGSRIAGGK